MDIKINGEATTKGWYANYKTRILFIHLLLTANAENFQVATSVKTLAVNTGLSVQSVRTALKNLQELGEIEVCTSTQYTLITILNHEQYFDKGSMLQKSVGVQSYLGDTRLSLKAVGLLSKMLSLPDDWSYSINGLVAICKEKKASVTSALNELQENGYVVITKLMPDQTESGRIEYIYDVCEKGETR